MIDSICSRIRSEKPVDIESAVKDIQAAIKSHPKQAAHELTETWAKWLWAASRYGELARLSRLAILAEPDVTGEVERLQRMRATCLYYMGSRAMPVQAKALYNVCSVESAPSHFDIIAKQLKFWKPDDPGIGERFLQEQQSAIPPNAGVLQNIKPVKRDPVLEKAIAAQSESDLSGLLGKTNLLLLADRPDEALICIEKAEGMSKEPEKPTVVDAMARAMKAKDGHLSRAREWLAQQRAATTSQAPHDE
jgi:hypothetical protein